MFRSPARAGDSRYLSKTPLSFGAIDDAASLLGHGGTSAIANIVSLADDGDSQLWPEEAKFHGIMQDVVLARGPALDPEGSVYCTGCSPDISSHADLASVFAEECHRRAVEAEEESQRQANMGSRRGLDLAAAMQTEAAEARVERDVWSLLDVMCRSDLLKDVDEVGCGVALSEALGEADPSMSIREVVDLSLRADESLKKLRVLQDWLEKASCDRVAEMPAADEPAWGATLNRIRSGHRTMVTQLDPDAQLSRDGDLLPLEGTDVTDQESAMKQVWQCVRSGQIAKAQLCAKDQGLFWLAASLMGVADEFHEINTLLSSENNDSQNSRVVAVRHGNAKKPNWMNTCFDHSRRTFASYERRKTAKSSNASVSDALNDRGLNVAVLEASVFGALSNNIAVLSASPLVSEWPDFLWAVIKAHHDKKMLQILHNHRLKRAGFSSLFPGCSENEIAAESKYIDRIIQPDGAAVASTAAQSKIVRAAFCESMSDMLRCLYPEIPGDNESDGIVLDSPLTQVCLWRLQAAIIGGISSLRKHVYEMMSYFQEKSLRGAEAGSKSLASTRALGRFSGYNRLMRVYTHVLIWLKSAPLSHQHVSDIVNGDGADCLHVTTQLYVHSLIQHKRRNLVALYCVFLPRDQRIGTYVSLMQSLPASTRRIGESGSTVISDAPALEATEVLNSAAVYFRADLADITRAVVDCARLGTAETVPSSDAHSGRRRMASEYQAQDEEDERSAAASNRDSIEYSDVLQTPSRVKRVRYETDTERALNASDNFSIAGGNSMISYSTTFGTGASFSAQKGESAVAVDDEDVSRMDTLRWLCIDVQDRTEAVKQSNAFIRQLLLESKGGKTNELRLLLGKILPSDTLEVSKDVYGKAVRAQSNCDDLSWGSEYSQLKFWYYVSDAYTCIESWEAIHNEFQTTSKSLLGDESVVRSSLSRFKPKLMTACDNAVEAISSAIHCEADDYEDLFDFCGGVRSVWASGEKALVQQLCGWIDHIIAAAEMGLSAGEGVDVDVEMLAQLEACTTSLFCLDKDAEATMDPVLRNIKVGLADRLDILAVHDALSRLRHIGEALSGPLPGVMNESLAECIRILEDIKQRRQVMFVVVGQLMRRWAKILLASSVAFRSLQDHKVSLKYNRSVVHLATTLADENPGLQLYKLVSTETLRCMMADIATASIEVHETTGKLLIE